MGKWGWSGIWRNRRSLPAPSSAEPAEDLLLAGTGQLLAGMRDPKVRDARYRAARPLFELGLSIRRRTLAAPEHPSLVQLTGVYHNLLRRWAET